MIVARKSSPGAGAAAVAIVLVAAAAPALAFSGYSEQVLDNGLRVVLIQHRANPMVASSVVVGAGVVHEPDGANGASHLLEHLLFNGTERRTQKQLYDEVDRFGAYNNATTREDHTLFSLLIQKEFAENGLDIQADMLFHSTIPEENFDKEKGIVLEEMARDEGDPGYRASLAFRARAFAGTPLARPVLGTRDSIGAITRDTLWRYYKDRYVPSNMVLVVMGDFEAGAMMETVKKTFGRAPAGPPPAPARGTWPAVPDKRLLVTPVDAERTYVHAAFPLRLAPHDPLMPAVELLLGALAGGDDAPLRRELTTGADPAALSMSLGAVSRAVPWSTVELDAIAPKDKPAQPILAALANALRDLGPGSPARGRIDSVRSRSLADDLLSSDQIHYYVLMRSAYVLGSPRGFLERSARRFESVTEEQIDAAAAVLAKGLGEMRAAIAAPGAIESTSAWAPPEKGPAARAASRRVVAETLASGLETVFERSGDSDVFALHLMFRPRSASEPPGKEGIASFLHRLFPKGTIVQDAAALSARLDALGANLKTDDDARVPYDDYYTTPEFSFVRLEMPADRWREGVALLAEIVRFPRLVSDDIEAVRREMLDLQARRSDSSRAQASDLLDGALAPGHPLSRRVLGTPESIGSITIDDLRAFHRDYVSGRRMILTGVSPIDPGELLDAVRGAFEGLPEGPAFEAVPSPPLTESGIEVREGPRGKGSSTIMLGYLFDAPKDDAAALTVAGAILSDRLTFRLREEKGLAYSMGASIGRWGGRMRFQVVMSTRPENLDEALRGLREGIAEFKTVDEAEVRRTAAAIRGRLLMRRLTRLNQAYYYGLERLEGRAPQDDLARLEALLAVGPDRVAEVARRYLDPSRCATIVAE